MAVVLDTDPLSVLQWQEQPACDRLLARLDRLPTESIATTLIRFPEQVEGWLAYLKRARRPAEVVRAYANLEGMGRSFLKMTVLSLTDQAQERFSELRQHCPRLPTLELRIASIALVNGATLLSRNLRHFRQVPGLVVEDWTA
jgi:tRNA(fMet)-specific endonuclease VapC